jgi:undecaprenyl pyrophosphate phosphatase UppP
MWIIIAVILCTAIVSVRLMQKTNVLFSKKMKGVILAMVVGCIVITSIIEQHAQSQSTKGINDVTWKNPDRDS